MYKLTIISHVLTHVSQTETVSRDLVIEFDHSMGKREVKRRVMQRVKKRHASKGIRSKWADQLEKDFEGLKGKAVTLQRTCKYKGRKVFTYKLENFTGANGESVAQVEEKEVLYVLPLGATGASTVKGALHIGKGSLENPERALRLAAINSQKLDADNVEIKNKFANGKSKINFDHIEYKPKATAILSKWSNAIKNECKKFGIDPDLPPTAKPHGMKKKVWAQITKRK